MLFVISLNDANQDNIQQTQEQNQTGLVVVEEKEHLDSLVEMIDEGNEGVQLDEEVWELQNITSSWVTSSWFVQDNKVIIEIEEEEEWFFSKLFGKKDTLENEKETPENEIVVEVAPENQENLVKDTQENVLSTDVQSVIATYAPEIQTIQYSNYPGISLETSVGKEFQIGVHALKLNNKYFNETLGYMMKGDKVKQLQAENAKGCFEVEIITAQNTENIWKTGYVCKKYLQDLTSENVSGIIEEEYQTVYTSKIGDIITVEKKVVLENGIELIQWDQIDQMTVIDTQGCFIAHIFSSATIPSVVPIARVCMGDIKN